MKQDIAKLDPNFATRDAEGGLLWYDARHLTVLGRGWNDTAAFYDRLPARARGSVPEPVYSLAQHSAGFCIQFSTDSPSLSVRWRLRFENLAMHHMPATGVSGVDLYVAGRRGWRWAAIGIPAAYPESASTLLGNLKPAPRRFQLYLPLYNGVDRVELGVAPHATLAPLPPPADRKPICFYGTSIVQGGCASRPGMAYPAILSRWLDWPAINLGFSGSGKMEPAVGGLLAELDPAAYVLDAYPNMGPELTAERAEPFVRALRQAHPDTPIVLVEHVIPENAHVSAERQARVTATNAAARRAFANLTAAGVPNLHAVPARRLFGSDNEATVDGVHATDLGFLRIAKALQPVLRRLL